MDVWRFCEFSLADLTTASSWMFQKSAERQLATAQRLGLARSAGISVETAPRRDRNVAFHGARTGSEHEDAARTPIARAMRGARLIRGMRDGSGGCTVVGVEQATETLAADDGIRFDE
jgi:hypothetical protein